MGWFTKKKEVAPAVRVERVEVPVVGDAMITTLYSVYRRTGRQKREVSPSGDWYDAPEYKHKYYATCEQAHEANPDHSVARVNAVRVGRAYFLVENTKGIKVEPRPKVAKGKRGAR